MGQSWSIRAAEHPTFERQSRKGASKSERRKGNSGVNVDYNRIGGTHSTLQRRDAQTVSNSGTPTSYQGDRRQAPSCTSRHAIINAAARTTKEESSIPARSQDHQELSKKPKPGRTKSKKIEETNTKHSSISRKNSHENHHERHRSGFKQKKECVICTDTLSFHRFPDRPPTKDCKHGVDACRNCLGTWIESEFNTKFWDNIKCPVCSISMKSVDIQKFAPKEMVKRYIELYNRAKQEAQPGFTWCNMKGCKAGQVHLPYTSEFLCNTCGKTSCIVHNVKWHKEETCSEYDYRTNTTLKVEEEEASKRVIEATTKQCPGCKRPIEKNRGCDHMECTKCRVHFCWKCLLPYHSDISRRWRDAGGGKYCECH